MNYTFYGKNNSIVYVPSEAILIQDTQSALDFMMTVAYDTGCNKIIIDKSAVCEEFFRLSSGIAGEILQKYINYKNKLAIVGDYTKYTSKPLRDFIYECNNGKDFFFVSSLEQAIEKLDAVN
jgi:hypothetical protein